MGRQGGNDSRKSGSTKLPATLVEFPQAGTRGTSGNQEEFQQTLTALTPSEQSLYDQLLKTARKLAKRRVPDVYSEVADVVEEVSRVKAQGGNAIPELARGLDAMATLQAHHRSRRLNRFRTAARDNIDTNGGSFFAGLGAVAAFLIGYAGYALWYYVAAFAGVFSLALLIPMLWDIFTTE